MLPRMATMNISLPDELRAYVESQVATGYFANVSDFMRHLIRMDAEDGRGRLRELIAEGERSGISELTFEEIIAKARKKAKSRAA
jgi:antitoxin ParD1/3/4